MTSIIKTSVLRAAVLSAFDLGRYHVRFETQPTGDDLAVVPASIVLDLAERDDDLFDAGTMSVAAFVEAQMGHDDHGPAVPAQGWTGDTGSGWKTPDPVCEFKTGPFAETGPRIYEFALQDAVFIHPPANLENISIGHSPRIDLAHAADWVHVYDRVTRERRTLKRPTDPVVVKGMADVAADLRGGPVRGAFGDGERGKEMFVPAADPMPPVGPLTSTEGLKAGDVVRCDRYWKSITTVEKCDGKSVWCSDAKNGGGLWYLPEDGLAFVARPGVWMPWEGGENPVPGFNVMCRYEDHPESGPHASEGIIWAKPWAPFRPELNVAGFMVVDTPPATSDT